MTSSNNVVLFPKKNNNPIPSPEETINEIHTNMENMRHYHIQETMHNLIPLIFNQLEVAGFHMDDEDKSDIKTGAFVIESIRSLMCNYYQIYHPFQKVAENIFIPDQEETDGTLKVADTINITLEEEISEENENVN